MAEDITPEVTPSKRPVSVGRKQVAIAVGVVAIAAVAYMVWPKSHTITGKMELLGDAESVSGSAMGQPCSGLGGYSDMDAGADVTVKDQDGSLIATGSLGPGEISFLEDPFRACAFRFTVNGVPDASFYEVEVGRRGGLTYSKAEMEAQDWTVEASLGDFEL